MSAASNRLWNTIDHRPERTALEQLLTAEARKEEPGASTVTVSFDCEVAMYQVGDRYRLRKLSAAAKKFLLMGGDIATVESLFEG